MCSTNPREYYQVSYGEKEQNHTDLYKNTLLPNGAFSPNQYIGMGPEINSPYDENYPYLSKDGNTLYFSSKGHNSMGGYDIFKITRKDSISPWSKPQNLGYPINSTYDDILFIPDESNQTASYCTNRKIIVTNTHK
ncbi:MAG: PD40 domain-containing protein [Bacteroidetes bacterium]|nr:PD40 domain-containing protein [Bacteroidota bacterium]